MKKPESYLTIREGSEGLFRDRGSRFIARAVHVTEKEEALRVVDDLRREYHDARHHCWAYRIGVGEGEWRVNDDGEPAGSAGNPILGQIRSFEVTDIVIVVVRYFGGTLLGVGGLINAYKTASREALEAAVIIRKKITEKMIVRFPYERMKSVTRIIREEKLEQSDQKFELNCSITLEMPPSKREKVTKRFSLIDDLIIEPGP
ncbi:MAG: YigZ family protein [Bacteroidales bacterium]|nr:YigZ family protein [Bacteroidales bacterium]